MIYKSDLAWAYNVTAPTLRKMLAQVPGLDAPVRAKRLTITQVHLIIQHIGKPLKEIPQLS